MKYDPIVFFKDVSLKIRGIFFVMLVLHVAGLVLAIILIDRAQIVIWTLLFVALITSLGMLWLTFEHFERAPGLLLYPLLNIFCASLSPLLVGLHLIFSDAIWYALFVFLLVCAALSGLGYYLEAHPGLDRFIQLNRKSGFIRNDRPILCVGGQMASTTDSKYAIRTGALFMVVVFFSIVFLLLFGAPPGLSLSVAPKAIFTGVSAMLLSLLLSYAMGQAWARWRFIGLWGKRLHEEIKSDMANWAAEQGPDQGVRLRRLKLLALRNKWPALKKNLDLRSLK